MRSIITLSFCLFAIQFAMAGASIDWFRTSPGLGYWTTRDAGNNVYTVSSDGLIRLQKYDKFGNHLWEATSTTSILFNYETPRQVLTDLQGNVIVVGLRVTHSVENGDNANAILVIKYTASGTLLWKKEITGYWNAFFQERYHNNVTAQLDAAGNIYVASGGNQTGGTIGFNAIKITPSGNIAWFKTKSFNGSYYFVHNIRLKGNRLGLAGYSSFTNTDALLWVLDTTGAGKYSKKLLGGAGRDVAFDNNSAAYLLTTIVNGAGANTGSDVAVYKFSQNGTQSFVHSYDFGGNELVNRMEFSPDAKLVISASGNQAPNTLYVDWLTLKLDLTGNLLWSQRYDEHQGNDESPGMMAVDVDGDIFVTGNGGPFPGGSNLGKTQWVTVKYLSNGTISWVLPIDTISEYISGVSLAIASDGNLFVLAGVSSSLIHILDFTGTATCNAPIGLNSASITNDQATISWNPVANATLYHLEYKTNTASSWNIISTDATSFTLTGLFTGTVYDYRVQAFCNSGPTAYSVTSQFSTLGSGYCASAGNSTNEWIDLVFLGSLLNSTGNDGGYEDYTILSVDLVMGSTNSITLSADMTPGIYNESWIVWIDYNHDGDFTDVNEQVVKYKSSQVGWESHNFTVPLNATTGPTRMRVSMKRGTPAQTSCETFAHGEVEDYTVNILPPKISGDEKVQEPSVTIFPNPVSDQLNISFSGWTENTSIKIFDLQGRLISIVSKTVPGDLHLDVNDFVAGTYFLSVQDEQGHLSNLKWMKL